jgi:hypothetical protein
MQDIRLVGNDGEYLNLETQSGDKFRLVLDESLRAAVKRDNSVQLDSVSISPREIQDAVRAGMSAEEVATKHSVPLDYVDKFALTVIDEIGHIIASAQAVRIAVSPDRYSETAQMEFGEVISERIAAIGGKGLDWSAVKFEGMPWQVTVTYKLSDEQISAIWSFDQRKLVLSPENEAAVKFSSGAHGTNASTTIDRSEEPIATQVISLPQPAPVEEPERAPVVAVVPDIAPVSAIEELTRASISEFHAPESDDEAPLTATADLLEALRKKRAEAQRSETTTSVPEAQSAERNLASVDELVPVDEVPPVEEVAPNPVTPAKKGRPSMPSWDEIVFGTKTDD